MVGGSRIKSGYLCTLRGESFGEHAKLCSKIAVHADRMLDESIESASFGLCRKVMFSLVRSAFHDIAFHARGDHCFDVGRLPQLLSWVQPLQPHAIQ